MITLNRPGTETDSVRTVTLCLNGKDVPLSLDINQPTQRFIYEISASGGLYEAESTAELVTNLRAGETFFDVGANCGWFSAIALGLGADVVAFEPASENLPALKRNAPGALVVNGVATDHAGFAKLYINLDNDGGHCLWECGQHPHNTATVAANNPTRQVMAYMLDSFSSYSPSIIKIDTEGAECNVLLGAERVLSNPKLRMVICERHTTGLALLGHSPAEVVAIMERHGFKSDSTQREGYADNWIFKR